MSVSYLKRLLTDDDEGYLLSPKLDVELQTEVVDGDFEASGDGICPSNSIEDDVDRRYEDLPHAVKREEVSQRVKITSFESL